MNAWAWDDIALRAGGSWLVRPASPSCNFAGVSIDSRALTPGQIFFAFVGERADGHAFLARARDAGAAACVVTDAARVPDGLGIPVLVVPDALASLTALADAWRERIDAKVVAVTGSNGKTTTCRLMRSVCAAAGKTHASPRSFNNALGVPITILGTPADAQYLVAEVGMSTPGEIGARTRTLRPDIAIITSIGRTHLEGIGSVEGIAREKARLIADAPPSAVGVIPGGISPLEDALRDDAHRLVRLDAGRGLRIQRADARGCAFTLDGEPFEIPVPGAHNAHNAALCVLVGRELGLDDATIRRGLGDAEPPPMRFERVEVATDAGPIVVINDAYNANPDSMRAALSTFASLPAPGRRVAVLGEMLELGSASREEHLSLAAHASGLPGIDRVILLGAAYEPAEGDAGRARVIADRSDQAVRRVAAMIEPGDTVLIKGSRGVRMERLIDKLSQWGASDRSNGKENAHTTA